jgi:hypothetical protein
MGSSAHNHICGWVEEIFHPHPNSTFNLEVVFLASAIKNSIEHDQELCVCTCVRANLDIAAVCGNFAQNIFSLCIFGYFSANGSMPVV